MRVVYVETIVESLLIAYGAIVNDGRNSVTGGSFSLLRVFVFHTSSILYKNSNNNKKKKRNRKS
jgi:hypothetical protein